jgi:hypothetical protein
MVHFIAIPCDCQGGTNYIYSHALISSWKDVCSTAIVSLDEIVPGSLCTVEEHPYLGYPFFLFHPCETKDRMRELMEVGDGGEGGQVQTSGGGEIAGGADTAARSGFHYLSSWFNLMVSGLNLKIQPQHFRDIIMEGREG